MDFRTAANFYTVGAVQVCKVLTHLRRRHTLQQAICRLEHRYVQTRFARYRGKLEPHIATTNQAYPLSALHGVLERGNIGQGPQIMHPRQIGSRHRQLPGPRTGGQQ